MNEKTIIEGIDEKILKLTSDLVKIESPYFHEERIMDFAYEWLKARGLPAQMHSFHEKKVTGFKGKNVVGELKGSGEGPTVLLNGHLDTVNLCSGWTRDPYGAELIDGKLYGVGALDMKSGSAAIMLAIEAFARHVDNFNGSILYTLVCDEEGPYGLGTNAIIVDGIAGHSDVAVVPEPSAGFCRKPFPCLCLGARGGLSYTVTVTGRSAHAAEPEKGISAILESSKLIVALKALKGVQDPKLGAGSTCITSASGGGQAACSVSEEATFSVFRHITVGENPETVRAEIFQAAKDAGVKGTVQVAFRDVPNPGAESFLPYTVSENNPYTKTFKQSVQDVTGVTANIDYFSSIGDFCYLGTRMGLPTYVFGPMGENFHSADEYVYIDSAARTAEVIYDYLVKILT